MKVLDRWIDRYIDLPAPKIILEYRSHSMNIC